MVGHVAHVVVDSVDRVLKAGSRTNEGDEVVKALRVAFVPLRAHLNSSCTIVFVAYVIRILRPLVHHEPNAKLPVIEGFDAFTDTATGLLGVVAKEV